jgi:hypothetical protein
MSKHTDTASALSHTDDERVMVCSCLVGWLAYPHNPRIVPVVQEALRKLEGVDKIVTVTRAE